MVNMDPADTNSIPQALATQGILVEQHDKVIKDVVESVEYCPVSSVAGYIEFWILEAEIQRKDEALKDGLPVRDETANLESLI